MLKIIGNVSPLEASEIKQIFSEIVKDEKGCNIIIEKNGDDIIIKDIDYRIEE